MFQIVYASSAKVSFSTADLVELLKRSRENNAKLGITGLLLYMGGNFLQALEGEEEAVRALSNRIAQDPRHTGFSVLYSNRSADRDFPDWSMGFRNLDESVAVGIEGFSWILESGISAASFANRLPEAKRLLLAFRDQNN